MSGIVGTSSSKSKVIGRSQDTAKVWCQTSSGGTVTDSFGVSSVDDSTTGNFLVNFTTAFATTNYAPIASIDTGGQKRELSVAYMSTSQVRLRIFDTSAGYADATNYVAIFGD